MPQSAARRFVARPAVRWVAGALLVGAVLAHALHGLGVLHGDVFFDKWLFPGVELAAAFACVARAVLVPGDRAAWLLFGIALACLAGGGIVWSLAYAHDDSPPTPSAADVGFLLFYPISYVGISLLLRAHVAAQRAVVWLDGLTAALAVTAVGTAVLLPPILATYASDTPALITAAALPVGDLLLLGFVVAALTVRMHRLGRAWLMLAGGFVINAVVDVWYLQQIAAETYVRGTILDSGWLVSASLIGFAAWQKQRGVTIPAPDQRAIFAPLAASAAALGLSVYGIFGQLTPVAAALTVATLFAVLVRLALTLAENREMLAHSQDEATTDALSGLGNRRRLMPDLEDSAARPAATLALFDLDGFKNYNDSFGHPAGDALLQRLSRRLEEAAGAHSGSAYRMGGDEFCLLLPCTGADAEPGVDAALLALSEQGEGFVVTASHGTVSLPDEASDAANALRLADQRLYSRKGGRRASPYGQTKAALLQVINESNRELGDHGQGVAALAVATARRLGMDAEQIDEVGRAAELHDIGKIAIPDEILRKPGSLTLEDWQLVREHTLIGERILAAAPALAPVGRVVRATHERWDGGGYPDGLAGEEIPLGSRVIAVCDAFDAMTSGRPYREAVDTQEALAELRRCCGTQFDPRVMEAFLETVTTLDEPWRDSSRSHAG